MSWTGCSRRSHDLLQYAHREKPGASLLVVWFGIDVIARRPAKLAETRPTTKCYDLITSIGLSVHARERADEFWTTTVLTDGDVLRMPEIGIEIPVAEFYEGTDLPLATAFPSPRTRAIWSRLISRGFSEPSTGRTDSRKPRTASTRNSVLSSGLPSGLSARYRLSRERPASRATWVIPRARARTPSAFRQ